MRRRLILGSMAMVVGVVPILICAEAPASAQIAPSQVVDAMQARSDYIENCGGCHGIQGRSAPALVPELRDRVGYFMCTPGTRAYLLRLPNVAHSRITDNAQLADLMNFVVFGLGGASAPSASAPITGEEVARERQRPLANASLKKLRADMVERLIRTCKAPASLRLLYPGQHRAPDG